MRDKTDGRLDPNAKETGQPMPCQLEELPLFPVRFSFSLQALERAAETGVLPPMPTKVGDPNYDLRRLRQGYLYILARVKHVGKATDEKKRWLVFEYNVSSEDSNSPEISNDKTGLKKRYYFTQYIWSDGTARGEWKKEPKSLPYAYVHPQVSSIECAYSEERWPPEMFEELERNAQKRAEIMQEIKFSGSDFAFPSTQMAEKVADFQPENSHLDKIDSARRATGLGYDSAHKVFDNCTAQKMLVIALHDPIGNIKDISAYHQIVLANDLNQFAKEIYPVTTAKAISQIQDQVYNDPGWLKRFLSSHPIDEELQGKMKAYAEKSPFTRERVMEKLAKAQSDLLNQQGKYTPLAYMAFLHDLCQANKNQLTRLASLTDYTMAFYGNAMAGFGETPKGVETQANMLIPSSNETPTSWGDHLSNLLTISNSLNKMLDNTAEKIAMKSVRFNVLVESVMAAQMVLWKENRAGAISFNRFLAAASLKVEMISVTSAATADNGAEIINRQMKTLINNADELFKGLSRAHYQAELNNTPRAIQSQHHIEMRVHIVVAEQNSTAKQLLNITPQVGTLFAGGLLLLNLREWSKYKDDKSSSMFLHPSTRLINDFAVLIASLERTNRDSAQAGLSRLYDRLDKGKVNQIKALMGAKDPIGIELRAGQGHRNLLTLQNVGRSANILGVVIAYFQAEQALRKGDKAAQYSATAAGLAEVSFLISTFAYTGVFVGIGVVLVISSVVISLVADNAFEKWVRTGFWGNSTEYWNIGRQHFSRRLSQSEILSSPEEDPDQFKKIKAFFEQEMQAFYNLIWGISIDTAQANSYLLKIHCPAFEHKDSINKLTVEIKETKRISSARHDSRNVSVEQLRKQFSGSGTIQLDMSQIPGLHRYHYVDNDNIKGGNSNTLTITVKYPKLGEDTSTFWGKFNADYFENQITYTGVK